MSLVVVVGTDSRTLYQSADTNGLLDKLSTFTNWQELVFGSVPLPIPDQIGIKIHPGSITATSILFEFHPSPSSSTCESESSASTVIGICVLWSSRHIKKHSHRITCLLENLKCDVERALRDNSHYLLSHLIDEFVSRHDNSSFTSEICTSQLPSLQSCLHSLEPLVGLNLVADVLVDALVSYFSPRRQKLIVFSRKPSAILQHLLYTIHHMIVIISSRSDLRRPTKALYNEPLFIQDYLDEKVVWFEDDNVQTSPINEPFNRDCSNCIETQACSPAFIPEANFIGERQSRIISSEEESLGYFSSSSSQGSTIAIEGCNSDDLNIHNEMDRDMCCNLKSLDACHNDSESLNGAAAANVQEESLVETAMSVKSDGIRSFQEVLREYRDLRFRTCASSCIRTDDLHGNQASSFRNIPSTCCIAVRENNGFLHTFHQSSSYASNLPASSSSCHCKRLGNLNHSKGHSSTQQNTDVENLVNLVSHGNYLLPHYLVQGLNLKDGDRIDNHIAYLSRCSCKQCTFSDHSCTFKTVDLDSLTQDSNYCPLNNDGQGFIVEMLRSAVQLQKLGLSDHHVTEFIRSKLHQELPMKAAVVRSCISSTGCSIESTSYSRAANIKGYLEDSIRSLSHLPLDTASRDVSFSWTENSLSSLVNSLSVSTKKVTSSIKSAINCSLNQQHCRNSAKSLETLPVSCSSRVFWNNLGIHPRDVHLFSSLPDAPLNHQYEPAHQKVLETFL